MGEEMELCRVEKRGGVYLLTLTGSTSEHRLNPSLLNSILTSLSQIRSDHARSGGACPSALVTAAEGKFFSNGFDLDWANASISDRSPLLTSLLKQTIAALLSLPMPTVAAVTGHASAAGLVLALSHDYLLMRSDRGFLYLSETDIGLPILDYFMAVVKSKVGRGLRDMVLALRKVKAAEGVEMGFVDSAVEGAERTVEAAVELGEELVRRGWDGRVYAFNRMAMLPDVCRTVGIVKTMAKL